MNSQASLDCIVGSFLKTSQQPFPSLPAVSSLERGLCADRGTASGDEVLQDRAAPSLRSLCTLTLLSVLFPGLLRVPKLRDFFI